MLSFAPITPHSSPTDPTISVSSVSRIRLSASRYVSQPATSTAATMHTV